MVYSTSLTPNEGTRVLSKEQMYRARLSLHIGAIILRTSDFKNTSFGSNAQEFIRIPLVSISHQTEQMYCCPI